MSQEKSINTSWGRLELLGGHEAQNNSINIPKIINLINEIEYIGRYLIPNETNKAFEHTKSPINGIKQHVLPMTYISSTHFCIKYNKNQNNYIIRDLSRNGVYINDKILGNSNEIRLFNKDIISLKFKTRDMLIYKFITEDLPISQLTTSPFTNIQVNSKSIDRNDINNQSFDPIVVMLRYENKLLENRLVECNQTIDKLTKDSQISNKEIKTLNSIIESKTNEIETIQSHNKDVISNQTVLNAKITNLINQLDDKEVTINELNSKTNQLSNDLNYKTQSLLIRDQLVNDLTIQLNEKKNIYESIHKENNELLSKMKALVSDNKSIIGEFNEANRVNRELTSKYNELKTENEKLVEALTKQKSNYVEFNKEIQSNLLSNLSTIIQSINSIPLTIESLSKKYIDISNNAIDSYTTNYSINQLPNYSTNSKYNNLIDEVDKLLNNIEGNNEKIDNEDTSSESDNNTNNLLCNSTQLDNQMNNNTFDDALDNQITNQFNDSLDSKVDSNTDSIISSSIERTIDSTITKSKKRLLSNILSVSALPDVVDDFNDKATSQSSKWKNKRRKTVTTPNSLLKQNVIRSNNISGDNDGDTSNIQYDRVDVKIDFDFSSEEPGQRLSYSDSLNIRSQAEETN